MGYFTETAAASLGLFGKKSGIPDWTALSDEALAARYREGGDKQLVGVLFQRYTYAVIGLAYKYLEDRDEARDLVMQVFEKLLSDLRDHEIQQFKPWFFAVVRNAALMELRSRKRRLHREDRYREFLQSDGEDEAADLVESVDDWHLGFQGAANGLNTDPLHRLEEAMTRLNEAQQRCVDLFYLKKKSYVEVSEITGYSMNQVKSHIQNGKRNLRILLEKGNEDKYDSTS